ncbi:hypothetical protein [Actinoallomurus sp. NPDC050550]|uniref:hypothetical protein n=1 Tax=Actinoallomurus sp. NPDC050550 TaxID=3154937 RepID=UPI0034099352
MSDATQAYAYLHRSSLTDGRLGLETSGGTALAGPAAHPRFFSGFLTDPAPAATGLLAVAKVLLALGVEVTGVVRPQEGIPALKAVAERGGSSRLVAEARRLTNVLPGHGPTKGMMVSC